MRLIHLDTRLLSRLHPDDRAERWLNTMAEAGIWKGVPGAAGSPPAVMTGLYEQLWAIAALEETMAAGRVTDKVHLAPPAKWWLWLPLAYLMCLLIALQRTHVDDRMMTFATGLLLIGGAAVGLMVWVMAATWSWRREKRRDAAVAREEREQRMAALSQQLSVLSAEPFVVRSGERLLVNCPDLRWVEDEIRALSPSRDVERLRVLQAARQRLQDSIQRLLQQPDQAPGGLQLDRDTLTLA